MLSDTLRPDTLWRDNAARRIHGLQPQDRRYRWFQSTLPVARGDLSLSSEVNVLLPAYAFFLSGTRQLVGLIRNVIYESCQTSEVDSVAECWTALGHDRITTDKKPFQRCWSAVAHESLFCTFKAAAPPNRLARVVTAAQRSLL